MNVTVPLVTGNNAIAIAPSGSAAPEIDNMTVQTSVPSAPSAPANLTATAIDPYTVKLTWTAPPTASYYIIQQNGITIASNVVGNTYTDTRIHFGKSTLSYAVIAVNQGGGTASTVSVTTPIDSPAGFQGPTTGSGAGNYFNWMSSNGASYYNLKRSTVSGGPYQTAVQVPNTTSLTSSNFEQSGEDTTAVPGTTYYYVVTAVDANGNESATSTYQIAATTPYPGFTLSPSPSSVSNAWGQSASATITLQPLSGFTGAVNYTIQGLPSGTTAAFGTASGNVTPLTLTTANGATTGTFNLTITGTQGSITASTTIQLTVASQVITFNPIPQQSVGNSLTLTASASSGLPVTFTAVPNGNCSVSGNVVTFLNTGNCGINASQAGGNGYGPAPTVGQIIVVGNPTAQTITFAAIASQPAGGTLALTATASSGLAVSYSSSTASVCTVSGSTASLIAAGTCTLTASQSGGGIYGPATPVSQSFTVTAAQQSQTITFNAIPAQTVGTTLTVSATASSGLPVTFSVVPTGNCSVSGNVVTFLNVGNCGVLANQAGNSSYAAAPQVGQIVVVNNPIPQTITFGTIAAQTVGTPLTLSATASSGLAVTFASSTTSICTVSGSTASFAAAGTCTITASQAGNGTYAAATPVSQSFTVTAAQQSQTITFNAIPAQTVGTTLTVSATASSGLPVTFSVVPNGNCSVSGNVVTFLNVGNCGVLANQTGNSSYTAAPQVGQIVVVNNPTPQTITFGTIGAQKVGTPLTLSATASSGLAVTFASSTTSVCTVSGSTASFAAAGTCTITASQAGNGTYAAATPVSQSFTVTALQSQTITFGALPSQTVGSNISVSATASSGLPVTFSVVQNGNCSVSGNVVTMLAAGNCGVLANQAGNSSYSAAPQVGQIVVVGNAAFEISAASSTVTLAPGNSGSVAIKVTPVGSFKGTLSYSVTGGPSGATYSFTQTSTTGTTLTIRLGSSTAAGTYYLTVTGASGSTNASTTIALTVS